MLLWFDILSPLCTMTRPNCTTFWDGEISPLIALAAYLQRATAPTISFAITWKRLNTCLKYTLRLRSYHERLISVSITAVFKLFWFFLGFFFVSYTTFIQIVLTKYCCRLPTYMAVGTTVQSALPGGVILFCISFMCIKEDRNLIKNREWRLGFLPMQAWQ